MSSRKPEDEQAFIKLQEASSNNPLDHDGEARESSLLHCHDRRQAFGNESIEKAWKKLVLASILALLFAVTEVVGGVYAGSLAIMTDAAHMFSDFGSFCISLLAIWIAKRRPSHRMSYGYFRAEIIGAVISVLAIWLLTGVLVYMAIHRIRYKEYDIEADIMMYTATFGVVINIFLGCILHESGVPHSHGMAAHSHESKPGSKPHSHSHGSSNTKNINVRAAFIHVIGDTIQSVGVLIAAIIIKFKPTWGIADPICTFIFSVLVMLTTFNILKDALYILCEGTPKHLTYSDVKSFLATIPGVKMVHALHLWSLNIDKVCLSAHLAIDVGADSETVLQEALQKLKVHYRIFDTTVQVETYKPAIMSSCRDCLTPADEPDEKATESK